MALERYSSRCNKAFARVNGTNLQISACAMLDAHAVDAGYACLYGDRDTGVVEIEFSDEKTDGALKISHKSGHNRGVSIRGLMQWMGLEIDNYPDRLPIEIVGERRIRIDLSLDPSTE